jgi:membrane-bound serine protease (ClpP class)
MNQKFLTQRLRIIVYALVCLMGIILLLPGAGFAQNEIRSPGAVYIFEVDGIINPPVANYIRRSLDEATRQGAGLVVLRLDTPGGLETAMREITQMFLASEVPVAVYVAPSGARAASAGLFILVAGNIAAMAPSTNTGSAHPVPLGAEVDEVMASKMVHDAAAAIRGLAARRDRNAEWLESAVRESVSITEREALEINVIDIVARDINHLLEEIQGWTVETAAGEVTLDVVNAPRVEAPMNFAEQLLHIISSPDIAFILLSLGTIGLIAELYNPGTFIPGIAGIISLILAFFALGNLPTNWAGVALIALALALLVAELNTEATGVLGSGATFAFLLGGLILFRPFEPQSPVLPDLSINPWVLGSATAFMAGFIFLVVGQVARTRKSPLLTGYEQYIGQLAIVHHDLTPKGRVRFEGQLWNAELHPPQFVPAGEEVRIIGIEGLTLIVEAMDNTKVQALPEKKEEAQAKHQLGEPKAKEEMHVDFPGEEQSVEEKTHANPR